MKPDYERSEQVVARVVAWHNRHPLAERISAAQVHSVGVVSLPFAVQGARVEPVPASEQPTPTPDLAPESAPDAASEPASSAAAGPAGVVVVEVVDLALEPEAVVDPAPAPPASRSVETVEATADAPSVAPSEEPDAAPPFDLFAPPAATTRVAVLPARSRRWHPLSWWLSWRGRAPFHALFSEDFIAPLRPRRVAGFVATHGSGRWPLQVDAPQRSIALDPRRLRSGGSATEVELHVITAAIGVGESRNRVLLAPGAGGRIVGLRHWSRARVAGASGPLALLLLGVGASLWWPGGDPPLQTITPVIAPLIAAASAPSAASASAPVAAASVGSAGLMAAAASATASAAPPAMAVSAPLPASSIVAAMPEAPASWPSLATSSPVRLVLPSLVARLAASDRKALSEAGHSLRSVGVVPPPAKAWALATRPADKEPSEIAAAQLKALALLQPMPMRAELLQARNGWRAVFWPFLNARDAEKARLALADKGLRTEVIEF